MWSQPWLEGPKGKSVLRPEGSEEHSGRMSLIPKTVLGLSPAEESRTLPQGVEDLGPACHWLLGNKQGSWSPLLILSR